MDPFLFEFKSIQDIGFALTESWVRYESTAGGWTKPHLLDGLDDGGAAVMACGLRVEPNRESEVRVFGPNGEELRTAMALLVPVEHLEVYPSAMIDGHRERSPACGVCLYEASKRAVEAWDKRQKIAWGLRYMADSQSQLAAYKFTGLT